MAMRDGHISTDLLTPQDIEQLHLHGMYPLIKRVIDILAAIVLLPLAMPLLLLVGLTIRIESPGPALFRQRRVGKNGRVFLMYKLRSMHHEADVTGARFAAVDDARITTVGRLMRRLHIDELPQLWCVMRGKMSLVGPRPEQAAFVEHFTKTILHYNLRHLVRPGISGWAQVTQGYADDEASTHKKLQHDLFYIKHISFRFDLMVLAMTLREIIFWRGRR